MKIIDPQRSFIDSIVVELVRLFWIVTKVYLVGWAIISALLIIFVVLSFFVLNFQ